MAYNKQSTAIEIRENLQNQFSDIMKAIPKAILFFKSKNMTTSNVTIEMVYNELKGVKDDLQHVKETVRDFKEDFKNFKYEIYNRFDQIDKRFEQADKRFERIENQQTEDHKILMELWKEKDNMKLSLTRTLLTVTGLFSAVIALIVSIVTGKAMIYRS